MKLHSLTLLASILISCNAFAQSAAPASPNADLAKIDNAMSVCLNSDGGPSEMGMKMCTATALQSADAILNSVYKNVIGGLNGKDSDSVETKKRLLASERAWISFRDADCSYQSTTDLGGSNEGLDYLDCEYNLTVSRVKELRAQ